MIRILLAFGLVFCLFYFGITTIRRMTGKERWDLTKTALYSILCAILTVIVLSIFVVTF